MVTMSAAINVMYVFVTNAIVVKEYLELQLRSLGGKKLKVGLYNGDSQDELLFYGSVDNTVMSIGIHRSCIS
jgi:hypothetical protein